MKKSPVPNKADGSDTVFTVAGTVPLFTGSYGHAPVGQYTELGSETKIVGRYFEQQKIISVPEDLKRMELLGIRDLIVNNSKIIGLFIVVFGVIITFTAGKIRRKQKEETVDVPYGYRDGGDEQ